MELVVRDVLADGDRAVVWFENRTANGVVGSCDWVTVEDDVIAEIRSFYDSAKIREILGPDDQASLDGSYQPRRRPVRPPSPSTAPAGR